MELSINNNNCNYQQTMLIAFVVGNCDDKLLT